MIRCCAVIMLCGLLSGCYTLKQAYWQGRLMASKVPVSQVLDEPQEDPDLRRKLELVQELTTFAERAGLEVGQSYSSYIKNEGPYVSYLVKASEQLQFKWVTWWFPVVGNVPYLGFFHESDRDLEAQLLRERNYDVLKTGATAFSGLGWIEDPIYASMLRRSPVSIAATIFHELVHRTFWFTNHVSLNEPLAELIGQKLTEEWISESGRDHIRSPYLAERRDARRYSEWAKTLRGKLNVLYAAHNKGLLTTDQAKQKKQAYFNEALVGSLPAFEVYNVDSIRTQEWNNAKLMSISLYDVNNSEVARMLHCRNDLKAAALIARIHKSLRDSSDGERALGQVCGRTSG